MPSQIFKNNHIPVAGLWTWDVQRDITYTDEVASQFFNLSASEGHEGRPLDHLLTAIHPEDLPRVERCIKDAIAGSPYRVRYRVLSRTLGERVVLANGRCFFDPAGKPSFYPGFIIDVSEVAGTAVERLSGHLAAGQELARQIRDPALSYLLEAAQFEVDRLRKGNGGPFN